MSLTTARDQAVIAKNDVKPSETRPALLEQAVAIGPLLTATTAMIAWLYVLALGVVGRRDLAAVVATAARQQLIVEVPPLQRGTFVRLLFRFGLAETAGGTPWPIGF